MTIGHFLIMLACVLPAAGSFLYILIWGIALSLDELDGLPFYYRNIFVTSYIEENTYMNLFGCIVCAILLTYLCLPVAILSWIIKIIWGIGCFIDWIFHV